MPCMELGYASTEEFLQNIPDTVETYDNMADNSKNKEEAKKQIRSLLLSAPVEELLQDIPDNSKNKEEAKKHIRSLLLSAPVGLTLAELEQDYCLFFGNKLPSMELGYASTEEFLLDIPDTVAVTYKGGIAVLKGISDATTEHIQKMVSRQRLDTRKNWGTLKISTPSTPKHETFANRRHGSAYKESSGSRYIYSSPDQDLRHQAVHAVRDSRPADLCSNSHHMNLTTNAAPLLDSPPAGPFSYSHHRMVRRSPLLMDNQHAEPQSNSCHRTFRRSPLLGDNQHAEPQSNSCHRTFRRSPLLGDNQHAEPQSNSCQRNVRSPLLRDNQHMEPQSNSCQRNFRSPLMRDNQHMEPHSKTYHRNIRIPPFMVIEPGESRSDSHHRNVGTEPLLRDFQQAEPCSDYYHKNARTVSPWLDNGHAHTRPQSLHRRGRPVPVFIQNKIAHIVKTHPGGIPLIHFSNTFHKEFGFTIDFWRLGYTSLFDFLSGLEDLVALKNSPNGGTWVMKRTNVNKYPVYNGLVDKHREMPELIHKLEKLQFPRARTIHG